MLDVLRKRMGVGCVHRIVCTELCPTRKCGKRLGSKVGED